MGPGGDTYRVAALVKWILIVFFAAIAIWTAALFFMKGDEAASAAHATGSYRCPMHHDAVTDMPGRCRICGMDLVKGTTSEKDDGADVL